MGEGREGGGKGDERALPGAAPGRRRSGAAAAAASSSSGRTCMMRKCGLFTFSCTAWNRSCTVLACTAWPLMRYLLRPPMTTERVTVMLSACS